jgi:MFS transporter, DHA1 family, multidrug resistance protein
VQGVTAGAVIVISRAVVRDVSSGRTAAVYFSRLILVFGVAPIAAPMAGGLILRVTTWRGVFAVLLALGVLLLVAAAFGLPETLTPGRRRTGGLRRTARDLAGILRDRPYLGYVLTLGLAWAAMFSYISGASFVFQGVFRTSPQVFALLFGCNALGFVAFSQLNSVLVRRFEPRRLLVAGLGVMLAAVTALLVAARWHSLAAVEVPLLVFLSSLGVVLPNTMALALDRHPRRAGAASAALGGAQALCGALAAPLVGLPGAASALPMAVAMVVAVAAAGTAFVVLTGAGSAQQ